MRNDNDQEAKNWQQEKRIPVFVICTLLGSSSSTGSAAAPEIAIEAEKFSAATLADVLVDLPASLPFLDVISYVLNQLHLQKEDTFCSKGGLETFLQKSTLAQFKSMKVKSKKTQMNFSMQFW